MSSLKNKEFAERIKAEADIGNKIENEVEVETKSLDTILQSSLYGRLGEIKEELGKKDIQIKNVKSQTKISESKNRETEYICTLSDNEYNIESIVLRKTVCGTFQIIRYIEREKQQTNNPSQVEAGEPR